MQFTGTALQMFGKGLVTTFTATIWPHIAHQTQIAEIRQCNYFPLSLSSFIILKLVSDPVFLWQRINNGCRQAVQEKCVRNTLHSEGILD